MSQLTLEEIAWVGEGGSLRNGEPYQYEVHGLPSGERATIANFDGAWRVLRTIDHVQGEWTGSYTSREEALRITPTD